MNRWTIHGGSTAGIVIAAVILFAGIAEGNLHHRRRLRPNRPPALAPPNRLTMIFRCPR
jgi:hypothetical protein